MKATVETPNTLFLAVWSATRGAVLLGTMRGRDGDVITVMVAHDPDPVTLLACALEEARLLVAKHVIVFTNDAKLLSLYCPPVRLEPTAPARMHLYDPRQWAILRNLCCYQSWQVVKHTALPNAKALWEEIYGNRN